MKKLIVFLITAVLLTVGAASVLAAGSRGRACDTTHCYVYFDQNGDSVCDASYCHAYFDQDGDGVCDASYCHAYCDQDGDGVCDASRVQLHHGSGHGQGKGHSSGHGHHN